MSEQAQKAIIPVNTPLLQAIGGNLYQLNVETTASQVKTGDGLSVETRLTTMERAISGNATVRFVDNIAARDALSGLIPGDTIVVADASGDPTVKSGGARYIWLPDGNYKKISEDESMDVVLEWANIEHKPTSTVENIDQAVAKQHVHGNGEVLAKLNTTAEGALTYDGRRVFDGKRDVAVVSALDSIPADLRDGGLIVVNPVSAG